MEATARSHSEGRNFTKKIGRAPRLCGKDLHQLRVAISPGPTESEVLPTRVCHSRRQIAPSTSRATGAYLNDRADQVACVLEVTPEMLDRHMADLCERPGKLPSETATWLRNAARAYMACEGTVSLDRLLGLQGTNGGPHTWLTQLRRSRRNEYLQRALAMLSGGSSMGPKKAAVLLIAAIDRFDQQKWPTWQLLSEPPADADDAEVCLFHACKLNGGSLPRSWQAVRTAVERPEGGK